MKIGFDLALVGTGQDGISSLFCQMVASLVEYAPQHQFLLVLAASGDAKNSIPHPWSQVVGIRNVEFLQLHPQNLRSKIARKLGFSAVRERQAFVNKLRTLDVLHWNPRSEREFRYLDSIPEVPKVVTLYDATTDLFPEYHTSRIVEIWENHYRRIEETASWWISISQNTRRDLAKIHCLDPSQSAVIYPSPKYNGDSAHPVTRQSVLEDFQLNDTPYVLSVGTLEPRKNHCRLIEAFEETTRRFPDLRAWRLVLVGRNGWKNTSIVEKIRRSDNVIYTGAVHHDDLSALYAHASAFAYPSLYEGFGLPVAEAMTYGLPVLTSTTSSLPEVVGDAAITVDPLSTSAIGSGLERIMRDGCLRDSLSKKAIQRAKRFEVKKAAEETLAFFKRVNEHWTVRN